MPAASRRHFPFLFKDASAPFDHGKALAFKAFKGLRSNLHRGIGGIIRHKHTKQAIGARIDLQIGDIGISLGLERDHIVGIFLHNRQPVNDKLVCLSCAQSLRGKRPFQKGCGILSPHTKALGKIPLAGGHTLPIQRVILLAVGKHKRSVGTGNEILPAVRAVLGIRAGQLSVLQAHPHRALGVFFRIKVNNRFFRHRIIISRFIIRISIK